VKRKGKLRKGLKGDGKQSLKLVKISCPCVVCVWEWQSHLGFQASLVTWAYDNLLSTKQEEGEEGRRKGEEKGERRANLCRALAKVKYIITGRHHWLLW
jgi:hypothetical protein